VVQVASTLIEIKNVILDVDCSESYRKDISKFIKQVFEYALQAGYIIRNPCPAIKFKINEQMFDVLNKRELKTLIKKAKEMKHPWHSNWVVAIHSGMRSGELFALEISDIDLDRNMVFVKRSRNKDNKVKVGTKGLYDRNFKMSKPLRKMVIKLIKEREGEQYLLPRIQEWDTGCQAAVLREFLGEIGLTSIRYHDLRASWATLLLSQGIEPAKVMKVGGWKDWKVFQRYIRKAGIDIDGVAEALDCLEIDE
jgi:integrase